jgi:hypothetical protein
MHEQSLKFVKQLLEKTEQGKISWTTGFEDEQYKTILPGGKLAFVVQKYSLLNSFSFSMFDENQDEILQERISLGEIECELVDAVGRELYHAIQELYKLAKAQALHVDEKLVQAEKLLAAI